MSRKASRSKIPVVVVSEDLRTEQFMRYVLTELGFRNLTYVTAPSAAGSAEQWVLARYVGEVRKQRSTSYKKSALVATRDGDSAGVKRRKAENDAALAEAGLSPRKPSERIATPCPTWSIETWLLWLDDVDGVREDAPLKNAYERRAEARVIRLAARRFAACPPDALGLPSLADGRRELERLDN